MAETQKMQHFALKKREKTLNKKAI